MEHELKCWPEFFTAVQSWNKTFEIRHNDRSFGVGDILWLREWNPANADYTGASVRRKISYITDFSAGLRDGYVCMGLQDVPTPPDWEPCSVGMAEHKRVVELLRVAEEDTARLEWLIKTGYQHNDDFRMRVSRHDESCFGEWKTLRDAIDAARGKEKL